MEEDGQGPSVGVLMDTQMTRCRGWPLRAQRIVAGVIVQPDEARVPTNEVPGERFGWYAKALCNRLQQRERDLLARAEVLLHDGSEIGAQTGVGPTVETIL